MSVPHVAIVGGGFGGLAAARGLRDAPVRITLVDRQNHHVFQPLLYQVATAALSPGDIASPIRWILRRQQNVRVLMAEALSVDAARQVVVLDIGELPYDVLVLAAGATHAYFGRDDWAPLAPGLKTLDDALDIRRRVLLAFERAERESDETVRRRLLTFAIVGAGPTGVELAGALAEVARHALAHDFRSIDPTHARIVLLDAGPAVLPAFAGDLRAAARRALERLGVEVRTGAAVTRIEPDAIWMGDDRIDAATVLWAAGIAASPLARTLGVPLDRAGRVPVAEDLTVARVPNVYVIGDMAAFVLQGRPLPGVAPVAMQQGRDAAANIVRTLRGEPRRPFRYRSWGNLATIGRAAAVADFGWISLSGWIAWVAWLTIHIWKLIGFRNRLAVMVQWWWSYLTHQRAVRLITGTGR